MITPNYERLAHWNVREDGGVEVDASKYLRLAHKVAENYLRRFPGNKYRSDDVHGEAMVGLMYAARRFDPSRGFKFTTYAWPAVWNALLTMADKDRTMMRTCPTRLFRLDQPLTDDGMSARDVIPAREPEATDCDEVEDRKLLSRLLRHLKLEERRVVEARYVDCLTLQQIADKFGFASKQTAKNRLEMAFRKMRAKCA